MNLIWLGLLAFSIGWLFIVPIFNSRPDLIAGIGFFLLGAIMIFAAAKISEISRRKKAEDPGWYFLWQGGVLTIAVLALQVIIIPIYWIIGARYHHLNFLLPPIHYLAKMLGLEAMASQNTLYIQTYKHVIPITTTWERFAGYPAVNFLSGGTLIIFTIFSSGRLKKWLYFMGITTGYLILRYVVFVFIFSSYDHPMDLSFPSKASFFWNPYYILLSFLPLVLVLVKFVSLSPDDFTLPYPRSLIRWKHFIIYSLAGLFAFFIIGFKMYQDPGIPKQGRVLFDQAHSPGWEVTTERMDTKVYGTQSVYNYYCLVEWLNRYFSVERNLSKSITPDLLKNYDILVLYTPSAGFTESETAAIINFVREGGGLLLLGDHTNLLGITNYLNLLVKEFGIQFNYDGTNTLSTGYFSAYKPPALFSHPIVQEVSNFDFLSSCTLKAPILAEEVIIGYDLYSDPMDYSLPPNFFGKNYPLPYNDWGIFLQAVALKFGNGRVVAVGDSTPWSNFAVFQGGHAEMMLGALSFLNRRNHYGYILNYVFLGLAAASVIAAAVLMWKSHEKRILIPSMLVLILLSGLVSGWAFQKINRGNYTPPEPRSKYTRICFLKSYSNFELPPGLGHSLFPPEMCYDVFYEWTQRLDYVPSVETSLDNALKYGDAVVIINPTRQFSLKEQRKIIEYVAAGGRLLILDTVLNRDSTSNQLLANFGLYIIYRPLASKLKHDQPEEEAKLKSTEPSDQFYLIVPAIAGGKPVWNSEGDVVLFSIAQQGKGRTAAVVDSYVFSKAGMGHPMDVPDQVKLGLYEKEYNIFRKLFSPDIEEKQKPQAAKK